MNTQLKRQISRWGLLIFGINGCLGSGWLFAPLYTAKLAGPASLISWVIGGALVLLIGMTFVESAVLFPVPGISARLPLLTHGKLTGFLMSWIAWLSSVTIPPIEVQAALQYSAIYFPSLAHTVAGVTTLTHVGLIWAAILLLILSLVNALSFRSLSYSNFLLFAFKTGVILLVIFGLMHQQFYASNLSGLSAHMGLAQWHGILAAIASGGIIFALSFKHTVDLVGEVSQPEKAIPIAMIGSILACVLLYIGLQISFMGALEPDLIAKGWNNISFAHGVGPLLGLTVLLGLTWLARLLFLDAIVSPLGCGLVYVASASRIIYGMSKAGYLSKFLAKLNWQQLPMWAIMWNFIIGMLLFLPLPGWQEMMSFFVSSVAVAFAIGPIALLSLRYQQKKERSFKLWAAKPLCFIAFYGCNLALYWTTWDIVSKLAIAVSIGIIVFLIAYARGKVSQKDIGLKSLIWLIPYFFSFTLISYLGSFGGRNIIPFGWDFVVIGVVSVILLYLAVKMRLLESDLDALAS